MNKLFLILLLISSLCSCKQSKEPEKRVAVARVGDVFLYYDEIPKFEYASGTDSMAIIQNYINKWARKELVFRKAEENLDPGLKHEIEQQLRETRANLFIYQYQRQIMLQRMDTVLTEEELENYYTNYEKSFVLNSNIVKALFIKLPSQTPDIAKIRELARSDEQKDLQQLESFCFRFAEIFDDFNEKWITMDRLSIQINQKFEDEENFLKRNTFYEYTDSSSVYMITIRDYRLRSSVAPYEYVKDDIKRVIWNNRRFDFIQNLENGIYNDALNDKNFRIY
jgi:hypothetical protein